jgi:hypothetical protein
MPLNLAHQSDGDFNPFAKYNAKAGRFFVRPENATEDIEIINPIWAFDMANIKTGWIFYAEGAGPEKVWDPSLAQAAAMPAKKFKRGFEVLIFGNANIPGTDQKIGLREWSSTANVVLKAVDKMYAAYEQGAPANPDCIPIYGCEGVRGEDSKFGTNYEPLFILKAWRPRKSIPAFDEYLAAAKPAPGPKNSENPGDFADEIPF